MGSCAQTVSMKASAVFLSVLASLAAGQGQHASLLQKHNLPELFSYDHGSHSVAVYRGAALKAAIAAGLVKGFPGSGAGAGAGAGAGGDGRSGRQFVAPAPRPTLPPRPAPTRPAPTRPPPPPPAPVCGCSQKRLHQELDNMRKQMAALQKAMNTIVPLVMDIPMCA